MAKNSSLAPSALACLHPNSQSNSIDTPDSVGTPRERAEN